MKSLITILLVNLFCTFPVEKMGGHKLTQQEAEQILGASCQLKDSQTLPEHGGHTYKSTYQTDADNALSGKVSTLYFMFESYGQEAEAAQTFRKFRESNQTHAGFELMPNLGDEAFFHTDKENFCLIIARKGNEMIRLKVNKVTDKTSLPELKKVAGDLLARI
jgi:hypothetical protein